MNEKGKPFHEKAYYYGRKDGPTLIIEKLCFKKIYFCLFLIENQTTNQYQTLFTKLHSIYLSISQQSACSTLTWVNTFENYSKSRIHLSFYLSIFSYISFIYISINLYIYSFIYLFFKKVTILLLSYYLSLSFSIICVSIY